jgi:hypothetical protein
MAIEKSTNSDAVLLRVRAANCRSVAETLPADGADSLLVFAAELDELAAQTGGDDNYPLGSSISRLSERS